MSKIESSLNEDDREFIDENDIEYGKLLDAYGIINDKINFFEEKLNNIENERNNLLKFHLFKDLTQTPLITKYKYFECEFNFINFRCKGEKNDSRKLKYKNLGLVNLKLNYQMIFLVKKINIFNEIFNKL